MLNKLRSKDKTVNHRRIAATNGVAGSTELLPQGIFMKMLHVEQKRTERSRRRFVLLLLSSRSLLGHGEKKSTYKRVLSALASSTRETDSMGWYRDGSVVGVIFTEIAPADCRGVADSLLHKVSAALSDILSLEEIKQISLSCHIFPEDWHEQGPGSTASTAPYPELLRDSDPKRLALLVKACMDVAGSLFALALFSPILLTIAIAVKLTSRGPILFRQQRVGQFGKKFTFLKFRSMYTANNTKIHEEYVKQLIAGKESGKGDGVYKIVNDPRITPIGRFIRKTSLDELPQFLNVLMGDMSLVGPRPPIPYEVDCYDIWHKRRLLSVKPGITGLWQVKGRSRTKFDEMVRLDLQYGETWSVWGDIKILLQTPKAMFSGDGAY